MGILVSYSVLTVTRKSDPNTFRSQNALDCSPMFHWGRFAGLLGAVVLWAFGCAMAWKLDEMATWVNVLCFVSALAILVALPLQVDEAHLKGGVFGHKQDANYSGGCKQLDRCMYVV